MDENVFDKYVDDLEFSYYESLESHNSKEENNPIKTESDLWKNLSQ